MSHGGSLPTRLFKSRRAALAIVLLFGLSSAANLATPLRTLAWDGNSFVSSSESELIALTNRARASAGLRALRVDATLTSVARGRSKDMIERDYFSHDIPGGGRVFDTLHRIGYCYKTAGENIGWNTYPDDQATAAIQQMFMDSAGHRANLLGGAYELIGVGAYKGAGDKKMWTVLFADPCSSTARATPKPTPRPTPKPTPKPTARPTPKPILATAPPPEPTPTPAPEPTPTPEPTPAPEPTPTPTPTPELTRPPTLEPIPSPTPESSPTPEPSPTPPLKATPTPTDDTGSLRVTERASSGSLLDVTVTSVTGFFFGG